VYGPVRRALSADPELGEAEVVKALRAQGVGSRGLDELVHADFFRARGDAIFERIGREGADQPRDAVLAKVLPHADPDADSPLLKAFDKQYANAQAARALRRLALPLPPGAPPLFPARLKYAPIAPFGAAADACGFVDYPQSGDGKVRAVPLFVECNGVMYPQLGLALACRMLGTDPARIRLSEDRVIIPRPGMHDLSVPVRTLTAGELLEVAHDVPLAANVSWFGGVRWERMYDAPRHAEARQHLSIAYVYDACLTRQKIVRNNRAADDAFADLMTDALYEQVTKRPLKYDDVDGFNRRIDAVLAGANYAALDALPPEKRDAARRVMDASAKKLRDVRAENEKLRPQLEQQQARLRAELGGRAVLVGWTATASIADFLPTSLHPRCPGVVLHGVIFNQIMTGEVWRTLPQWATLLATLAAGLLATLAVSFLSPAKAAAAAILLAAGYLFLNGWVLFDRHNLLLGAAAPVVAIAVISSGGTLAKLGMERWERARITRRFRSYADPKLVDYVIRHPNENLFEGQVRELTVVFIDLVGFTRLTESMGASAVQLLNELWSTLIPAIKRNDAYVNKFLGDGLMFLYGAPEQSPFHARDAIRTVFDVRMALAEFNERAAAKGWPRQALRFGISTGDMIVGDTGEPDGGRTDYSVIGDYANLGARLESANKAVGTESLMTERTVELAGDGFLFRPIGKLCVVGKQTGVMTHEVLARLADATDAQKRLAADTKAVVESFLAGRLADCVEAIARMEAAHGPCKLTALYRERCDCFLSNPARAPFDCQIVLTEK
jgi:class 3 adenylate cyclase